MTDREAQMPQKPSLLGAIIRFCLKNKLVVLLAVVLIVAWGIIVAPFDW